jgi:hypothetical protein
VPKAFIAQSGLPADSRHALKLSEYFREERQTLSSSAHPVSTVMTIASLKLLHETSSRADQAEAFASTWSGGIVVATAWLAVYVVIVAVTINSEPLSRAVAVVAQ